MQWRLMRIVNLSFYMCTNQERRENFLFLSYAEVAILNDITESDWLISSWFHWYMIFIFLNNQIEDSHQFDSCKHQVIEIRSCDCSCLIVYSATVNQMNEIQAVSLTKLFFKDISRKKYRIITESDSTLIVFNLAEMLYNF